MARCPVVVNTVGSQEAKTSVVLEQRGVGYGSLKEVLITLSQSLQGLLPRVE